MKKYIELTDSEVVFYQKQLLEPNEKYPHYPPLIIDDISVNEYKNINPIKGEEFKESSIFEKIMISNYGRVLYNNEIISLQISGTFLHCTRFYIKNHGLHNVYRVVKETFDPIEDMKNLQVHHIDNNALDNRPENLIWVTKVDHERIDKNFNVKLRQYGKKIRENVKNEIHAIFRENSDKEYLGLEICNLFQNVSEDVIRDTLYNLEEKKIIKNISEHNVIFYDNIYRSM